MIYDVTNCTRDCIVTDGAELLGEVVSVDTDARTLVQCELPIRVIGDELATVSRMFDRAEVTCDDCGRAVFISLHGLQK